MFTVTIVKLLSFILNAKVMSFYHICDIIKDFILLDCILFFICLTLTFFNLKNNFALFIL